MNRYDELTDQINDTRERMKLDLTPQERRTLDRKLETLLAQRDALARGHDQYEGRNLSTDLTEDR